ncbi:hypothetical protein CMO92_03135 [Candidatus Woesearchaeota archaeon]|nr:hypothetical protein [Candidatus Woesearchaeota archaeon]
MLPLSARMAYVVEHDRPNCIGCGSCCVIAEGFWELDDDGKANITKAEQLKNGQQRLEIKDKDLEIMKDAAESCPVNVIHIKDKTGKSIV